jgi:hypothetical protein
MEQRRAAEEAAQYERYLELLVSVHRECSDPWDWKAVAQAAPPPAPIRVDTQESVARAELDSYAPGLLARWFGGAKRRRAELEQAIEVARHADEGRFQSATKAHRIEHSEWQTNRAVAERIVGGDIRAYGEALIVAGAFTELAAFHNRVDIIGARPGELAIACHFDDPDVVPKEEISLTAKGKLSTKDMAKGKYWALVQDHVCSTALRIGREVFAVLPVRRVVVNVGARQVNPSTGHEEDMTFVAAQFPLETMGHINFNFVDPSDAMRNFPHRMKFRKTSGFEPIAAMDLDEQWATSA